MKLKSNFSSQLDFKPLSFWPDTVPALALGHELICGFNLKPDHPVFEHVSSNPGFALTILKSIYPQLSLPEIARLIHTPGFKQYFAEEALLRTYNLHASPELSEVLEFLFNSTEEFQNFVSQKKMGPQELFPFLGLNQEQQTFVSEEILKANESKQDSVKRLELLSDLLQMNHSPKSLQNLNLIELSQKRYPVTSTRDQIMGASTLPWLSQIKTQFKRRGDKAGFEVHFFVGTPAELNKLAQNLTKVAQEWGSKI